MHRFKIFEQKRKVFIDFIQGWQGVYGQSAGLSGRLLMNSGLFDKFIIMCVHEIIILENSLLHNSYFRESHFL